MYSPSVNAHQLSIANKIFQQKYPEHKLIYHSESDVLSWREHLESIRGKDGTFSRELTVEEDRWITNERMVCKINHLYALRRYCYIVDRNKKLALFKPNLAQQIILATLGEMEEQRLELVLQFVKARRLGVSTVFELLIALRVLFDKNINSIISASNPEDTDVLSRMCLLAIERFPFWMRPLSTHLKDTVGRFKQGLFYEFHFGTSETAARNRIDLEHGTQFADIGRSQGPTANHLCLARSTLIPVGGGIVKTISEIVPGDEVLTSTGSRSKVRRVFKSNRRNEMTSEILLWGQFNPLSCTRDHPILTPDGFRPAHTLHSDDYVTMPVRRITGSPRKFEFPVRERGWKGKQGIAFVNTDKHLGWLLGLYLAEGSLQFNRRNNQKERRANSVYFSIHEKEVETFKAKLQKAVPAAYIGLGSRVSSSSRHLRIARSGLARWVGQEFGHTDIKRLPDWVWNCGEEFCRAIVAGYLEGDGHIPVGGNEVRATSVRLQILIQIRDLIASLGYGWSGIYFKPEGQHYNRNCQDAWTLVIAGPANENIRKAMRWPMPDKASAPALHWYYAKNKQSVNIQIYRTADGYCEEFYDLEVAAPEHDFCTIHCCVHNSEIAKYSNPASLIDAGLMKAMIPSPMNLCCLEGTSEGPIGYWPEKYDFNKKNYGIPGSGARMKPTFLPWFCLAPHSLVVVGDGMAKPISEIVAGDTVKTHTGKLARVKTAIRTPRTNELTSEIWVWGSPMPLSCTRDHSVLTPDGWTDAAKIHAGDYVIHPIRKISEERKTFDLNLVRKGSSLKHPVNRTMPFSFDWGRFLGLYLAEGSLSRTRKYYAGGRSKMYIAGVSIACHSKEIEEFSEIIRRAVEHIPGVGRRTAGLGAELRVNDASLGRWMDEHFGHRDQKRIPDWVWTCGRDFCKGLVAGYLEGDGHVANYKLEIAARSVRLQLHTQLRDLIASLGYGWSAITYFRPEGKMKGDRGGWYLHIRTECAENLRRDLGWLIPEDPRSQNKPTHWRYTSNKEAIAIEVDRNLDGFSSEFYDLEIDDPDHSFVTLQCAVHNCGVEIYPTETDLITKGWYQVCDTWEPDQKTIDHARHAREYVLSDPMLKKFLAKGQDDWQMSREQQFFFEADIKEYRKNNNLHIWLREMAPDDRSCWAAGEKSVFNADMLMRYRDATTTPKAVFGLKGMCGTDEIIAKRHHILGALHKLKSLRVTADWTKKYAPFEFEFYPVKFTGWNGFDETGKIIIFEWPKPGETYALAADNADGRGGDSSVLKILRKGGMGRCDAEAASFASSGISGTELWPWTLALGTLYSVMRDGKHQQPVFIPEINREGGGQLVKEMDYRGWKNFYKERRGRATKRGGGGVIQWGWHMNQSNRSELILKGIQAIEDELIEINSPAIVDEMDVFVRHSNGMIAAARHRHDDHLVSLFLAFWALYHDQARASGPDPMIQRTRNVSPESLFPLASEDIGSQISRHVDEMISERGWSL